MKTIIIYFSLILIIILGIIYIKLDNSTVKSDVVLQTIKVDLKGAVRDPGVKEVLMRATVEDVINLGGGLLESADTSTINLSKEVNNEDVIIVYTKDEMENLKKKDDVTIVEKECICPVITNNACLSTEFKNITLNTDKVSLNSGSKEELMTLSGIGESKADAIISYREKTLFNSIEDIMNVKGIGKALFEKIKDYITI